MPTAAAIATGVVAAIHFGISAVEMFFWLRPRVHERLGFSAQEAEKAQPIVGNVGLYNGFLAAGLLWGAVGGPATFGVRVFSLVCVIIAGIFGAATLPRPKWPPVPTTLLIQTFPALIALALVLAAHSPTGFR